MKVMIPAVLLVLSSTNFARGTFFGSKDKRGLFGFGYASAAAPVISVAHHHHHHLTYGAPITKIAYAAPSLPHVEPVTKVALTPQPITYGVPTISYASPAIQYAAPWPRFVYRQPVAVTKFAYATEPVAKVAYAAAPVANVAYAAKVAYAVPPQLVAKFAYSAPIIKKLTYDYDHY